MTGLDAAKLESSALPDSRSSSEISDRRTLEAAHASSKTRTLTARSNPLMFAIDPVGWILAPRGAAPR